jgi:hypothetical protein
VAAARVDGHDGAVVPDKPNNEGRHFARLWEEGDARRSGAEGVMLRARSAARARARRSKSQRSGNREGARTQKAAQCAARTHDEARSCGGVRVRRVEAAER